MDRQGELRERVRFLSRLTEDVARASTVAPGESVAESTANTTGGPLVRPGGRGCYPAFWIRDFTMSLDSGMFAAEELRHAIRLTAATQAAQDAVLANGSIVPRGAIVDHVRFDGVPIYFAGTYDAGKQGGEPWGVLPCFDDHFYFVRMVRRYVDAVPGGGLLDESVRGITVLERVRQAFLVPPASKGTEIVCCGEENRGVNFGFMDTIHQTGLLFFSSVLRCGAADDLAWLCRLSGMHEESDAYGRMARRAREEIPAAFAIPSGLFRASTGASAQPDVWGTALAVSSGVLEGGAGRAASEKLARAYREGTLAWRGNIRHVLTTDDFSPETCWERALRKRNVYQNGGYWGTPVGWVADAIVRVDPDAARDLFCEYVQELREGDFRKGDEYGSPWECMHPEGAHRQNPVSLATVACPLASLRELFG
jgi:hypothetical protein